MYLVSMENILCILDWGQKLSKSVLCVISFNPVSFFNTLANQFLPLCVSPEFHYLIIRCYLYFSISMSIRHVEFNCSESNIDFPPKLQLSLLLYLSDSSLPLVVQVWNLPVILHSVLSRPPLISLKIPFTLYVKYTKQHVKETCRQCTTGSSKSRRNRQIVWWKHGLCNY